MTESEPLVVWLDDAQAESRDLGGKGASLLELNRGGFRVPPGFVLSAAAYRLFVEANRLQDPIDALLATPDLRVPKVARGAAAGLGQMLAGATLPDALCTALSIGYSELQRRGAGAVAARSSALSEDGVVASSAGLYETYLNLLDREAVTRSVRLCYASLWSPRAVQYRAFKNMNSRAEAMAVVVMALVPADVSGVAFTANPMTADLNQIVVNASWGLGEAVVSGRVTPDTFVVEKATGATLAREIADKELEIVAGSGGASGTVTRGVDAARTGQAALSEEQIARLVEVCCAVEQRYGRPMDVEWAFAGDRIYLLQARPITSAL